MGKLAINGGEKLIEHLNRVRLPVIDESDVEGVAAVVRSGHWQRGGVRLAADVGQEELANMPVAHFEAEYAAYQGGKYAIAVCNGTAALYIALKVGGVKRGDEVIVPVTGFIGTVTVGMNMGAVPVLVDIDPKTYCISADAIEAAITPKTKAVIPIHLGGYPADMDRIMEIARKHNLVVIEDCAHAQSTQWRGQGAGSIGDFGTFSFQMSKTMTCGDGGLILTNDEAKAEQVVWNAGYRRPANKNFESGPILIFRIGQMQGALLRTQFAKFKDFTQTKERNAKILAEGLREIGGIEPIIGDPRVTRQGIWFLNLRYDAAAFDGVPRKRFLQALDAEGAPIGQFMVAPTFRDDYLIQVHEQGWPMRCCDLEGKTRPFGPEAFPVACRASDEEAMSIGQHRLLGTEEDMHQIVAAVRKVRDNIGELKS
jgi:dTDP-4-amino-4,6-dideoxygalactose transaminase